MTKIKFKDFTPEESLRFIQIVSDNPCLYNRKDMSYHDVLLKNCIWEGIAQMLNKTVPGCKKAWRYAKSSYVRSQKKYNTTGQVSDIYEQLSFLEGTISAKLENKKTWYQTKEEPQKLAKSPIVIGMEHIIFDKPIEILKRRGQSPKRIPIAKPSPSSSAAIQPDLNTGPNTVNVEEVCNEGSRQATSLPILEVTQNEAVSRIAIKHPHDDEEQCSSSSKIPKISKEDETPKEDTSLSFFALHVTDVIKKLPPMLQIQAKQEMFQVLTKYEIIALNGTGPPKDNQIQMNANISPQGIKVESNLYDSIIEFKDEYLPNAN